MDKINLFPCNETEALAYLYVQKTCEPSSPEELYDAYKTAYNAIKEKKKADRKNQLWVSFDNGIC